MRRVSMPHTRLNTREGPQQLAPGKEQGGGGGQACALFS